MNSTTPWPEASKPPLLERSAQLDFLLNRLAMAQRGQGSTIVLSGEAGIGKTSLLAAFAALLDSVCLLRGACEASGATQPLGPLFDMAAGLTAPVASLLFEEAAPARLFTALLLMIQQSRDVVVMMIEDVHWADQTTLDLIRFLGRRSGFLKLLLIVSCRTDDMAAASRISELLGDLGPAAHYHLALPALTPGAVGVLASAAGYSASEIYRVTGGNPFFVTELLASGGGLAAMPQSVRDAVWARAAKLSPAARSLMELMSIMPSGASRSFLETRLSVRGEAIDECLAYGLLRDDGGSVRFRHELARQAMMSRLSPAAEQNLHERVGQALNASEQGQDPALAGLRLHHALLANDSALALDLALVAAGRAARLGAHREAAEHLEQALRLGASASPERSAEIYEQWSYEAALANRIDEEVVAARHEAIARWRSVGRLDRVGRNLRWLSRLHWYRGEAALAEDYADQAIAIWEQTTPGPELAMCYSMRSQWHMLNDRTAAAVEWGTKALELADRLGDVETRVHALNNIGTPLLSAGDPAGRPYLDESLRLALANDFHEHAARVYTNLTEVSTLNRDLATAESVCADGIAFDTRHDLDSWLYYLYGCQARIMFDRGRYETAEGVARYVLARPGLTLVMHLAASTILGRLLARRGDAEGAALLEQSLTKALATGEPQRIVPVRIALAESAWLAGDLVGCAEQVRRVAEIAPETYHPWELGEANWWAKVAGEALPFDSARCRQTAWAPQLAGRWAEAASEWKRLGLPFEAAIALAHDRGAAAPRHIAEAVAVLENLGAIAAAERVKARASIDGVTWSARARPRGPYSAASAHPLGLTAKEQAVLLLMVEGCSNNEIAERLSRSLRTVEHHVSSILRKFAASSRLEVMLRVQREPWLLGGVGGWRAASGLAWRLHAPG